MTGIIIAAILIFAVSLFFSMFGRGGGELYLPIMITLLGISFYTAAGVSLFLIFLQGLSMVFIYSQKHKLTDWPVALVTAFIVGISSFLGGFLSKGIPGIYLKMLFIGFLVVAAFLLFLNKNVNVEAKGFGVWHRKFGGGEYNLNIFYLTIGVAIAGFLAGMIGISGCGLIIPIAILICGMPLRIAMGTNTFIVFASSSMGFLGHLVKGGINWKLALILGAAIIVGSQIGSRLHAKVSEKFLRIGFAAILIFAASIMALKALHIM